MKKTAVRVIRPIWIKNEEERRLLLVVKEKDGPRLCPMDIDPYLANLIIAEFDSIKFGRPSTHYLMLNTLNTCSLNLEEVVITELKDAIYRALIFLKDSQGNIFKEDSRPSDAVIMALIMNCSIWINDELLYIDEELSSAIDQLEEMQSQKTISDLNTSDRNLAEVLKNFKSDKIH